MAEEVIINIQPAQYNLPTPCTAWNLHMLLNHMFAELAWIPPLLEGKTITQIGDSFTGDLVGKDPAAAWHRLASNAKRASEFTPNTTMVRLSYAEKNIVDYLSEVARDIIIHSWDVAQATGQEFRIDEPLARELYAASQHDIEAWRKGGFVGPKIEVPDTATAETKLLALFGRQKSQGKFQLPGQRPVKPGAGGGRVIKPYA